MSLPRSAALTRAAVLGAAAWLDGAGCILLIEGRLTSHLREALATPDARAFFGASAVYCSLPQADGSLGLERIGEHVLALFIVPEGLDGEWLVKWLAEVRASFR